MKIRDNYTCPLEIVHDLIRGKWKTIIIFQLQFGNTSLSKLRRDISGVSEKMLIQHLSELQQFGIVDKISSLCYPLSVEYFLTERGRKVAEAVNIMQDIGIKYMVERGQTEFLDIKGIKYER
ncbi:MAG: helix-turn-helix transcriptional regulator [Oscillospiraceae bacterium]|jgi:DNA-binding HxlR family transcriptional regulator|nr:helix-turn-helix transcriptional regulator [Oscillospiraceae bacterium]